MEELAVGILSSKSFMHVEGNLFRLIKSYWALYQLDLLLEFELAICNLAICLFLAEILNNIITEESRQESELKSFRIVSTPVSWDIYIQT